nr:S41 family peptidase [Saprospiraceae bacterium]
MKYKVGFGLIFISMALLFYSFSKQVSSYFELTKNLEIFSNVYKEVNANYMEELDHGFLMKKGIDAMLETLDPYTVFISENQVERSRYMAEGRYDGVGMEIDQIDGDITVTFVYSDFGAHEVGIMAGDVIEKIEGRSLRGFDKEDVTVFMRGASGTRLNMEIYRPVEDKRFNVDVERQDVSVPNVPYSGMVDNGIAYVALSTFTPMSALNILNKLKELKEEHGEFKGIVLDLRNNGGGLLSEAINVSNLFLPGDKLVVSTKGKLEEWNRTFETRGSAFDLEVPLVVLINDKSASASEIVSGVMQDYDRGVLIGRRTYGKGLVQNVRTLSYNTQMRITTSEYFIPSGRGIQNVKYEDGKPVSIPDSLRGVFHTGNGREVLDGGGVAPDIEIKEPPVPEVIVALEEQHLLFKYATEYRSKKDSIAEPGAYSFDQYSDFIAFVEKHNFEFELESEQLLDDLIHSAEAGLYSKDIEPQIERIRNSLDKKKASALMDHREAITRLLEEEIVSRYYFEKGKTRQNLLKGPEIQEAIRLLNNEKRYHSILEGE